MANVFTDVTTPYVEELGIFSFPVYEFNRRFETIKRSNPQLSEEAAAANVYFGMLAQQPKPTASPEYLVRIWGYTKNTPFEIWLEIEKNSAQKMKMPVQYAYPVEKVDLQTAYYTNLANLQKWLNYYGLTGGIEKTLKEESRKRQQEQAQLDAMNAAAAYKLAMLNKEAAAGAELEAAQKAGKINEQLNENLEREAELKDELKQIEAGILPGTGGGISWPVVLGIGAAAFLLLRKKGAK